MAVYCSQLGRYVTRPTQYEPWVFTVTNSETGNPVGGAQCQISDLPFSVRKKDSVGCITDSAGRCEIADPDWFFPNYYTVYRAGYVTVRGSLYSHQMNIDLVPTQVMYWVALNAGQGGSVRDEQGRSGNFQVEANTKLTATAHPSTGNILDYWRVNGVNKGNTNPKSFIIDRDSYSIWAIFKEAPPPPNGPNGSEWPVTRQIHVFDNHLLKANLWDMAKKIVWDGPINVDLSVLLGGKIDYTVSYIKGTPLAENADIYFNGQKLATEHLNRGETRAGSVALAEIHSQNTTGIGVESLIGFSSEVRFDVWITLGFSAEPTVDPDMPPEWLTWLKRNAPYIGVGAVGLAGLYVLTRKGPPQIIVVPR